MRTSRRRFLAGAGGIALSLPWLEKLEGKAWAATPGPRRLIVVAYPMGVPMARWAPSATGSVFNLPYVTAPLDPFKSRCLFVSNIDNAVMNTNTQHSFGHPGKKEGVLTGTLLTGAFGGDGSNRLANVIRDRAGSDTGGPNNESVCNFIGSRIRTANHRRPSVDLAVNGELRAVNTIDATFFFEGRANPVSLQANPARAFYDLFNPLLGQDDSAELALRELRLRNKSVLDAVRGEFNELKTGLGRQDRVRLEEHAAKIRQVELEVSINACSVPTTVPGTSNGTAGSAQAPYTPFQTMSMSQLAPLQSDILAHAMACDLAPVGRMEFISQQGPYFGVSTVDTMQREWGRLAPGNGWHAMVHGDVFPGTNLPTRPTAQLPNQWAQPLLDGYRFFVEQFAGLLARLDAIQEGPEGSVLDHSLVVLCTDYGNGNGHNSNKMGFVMAGNTGPARIGYHLDCGPGYDFYRRSTHDTNQLLVSLIRMFGLTGAGGAPINSFGLEGFSSGVVAPLFA